MPSMCSLMVQTGRQVNLINFQGRPGLTARLLTIALPWWRCKAYHDMLEKTKKKIA